MRLQGRIVEWKTDRGFGFVMPNGGNAKVFLHVSDLLERDMHPDVGSLVTYEVGSAPDGRIRATNARFVRSSMRRPEVASNFALPIIAFVLLLIVLGYVIWVRANHPNSTIPATVYKLVFAREALKSNSEFKCSPEKATCSAMTSCAEAFFHQERCGVTQMDGDRDGIPCERQWCN
jgi:cold shock CspA family protein